ncbi:MAG: two-component regulator propeller domain-containing protein [Bacteroidota bacterium]
MNLLRFFCFVSFAFCIHKSIAQPYAFQTYSLTDGLPQSQVWCGYSDHRGFLWFGTQGGGLSRYDGLAFETFTTQDGLPSNFINALYQDAKNRLWVGTNQGLCFAQGEQFKRIESFTNTVHSLQDLNDSLLIIGTKTGFYSLNQDSSKLTKWRLHEELDAAEIYALHRWQGEIYAGTSNGLWRIWPDVRQLSTYPNVYDLTSNQDTLWAAFYGRGVYTLANEKLTLLSPGPNLTRPMSILKAGDGQLYVGTQNLGIFQYQTTSSSWEALNGQDQAQNNVRDLLIDQNKRLWLCTSGGGIACRNQQNFQHFDRSDGLAGERVYAIHQDTIGNLWLATSRRGLQFRDSSGFLPALNALPLGQVKYKTICGDAFGHIWIGSEGKGLAVRDSAGWYTIDVRNGLPSNWILKLLAHPDGTVWGATYSNGLFQIQKNGFRDYTINYYGKTEGVEDLRISALSLGPEEAIWFGTSGGSIGKIKIDKLSYSKQPVGLPGATIRSFAFDEYDKVWVGTKGQGLFSANLKADTLHFNALSAIQANTPQNIYLLTTDPFGQIWAGSENGVDRIQLETTGQIKEIKHYDSDEGFLGLETCHDAFLLEPDGKIWFGTMNGLAYFSPGEEVSTCPQPNLFFTETALFYKSLNETTWAAYADAQEGIKPGLKLPYQENHLSFSFRAISQMRAAEIRYRWRLLGADENWSPASNNRSVNYAKLPPGTYEFQVQAAVGDCPWTASLSASFVIESPFWQRSWFAPSAIGLGLLFISWIAWSLVRRIKKREQKSREKLEVQNKLLQLEQKALQLQMNPHFIFNALTGIQSLVALGEYPKARKRINEFAKLMRGTLNNARQNTITLQEEINTLKQYLNIEEFTQAQTFTYKIQIRDGIDPESILLPPMLLQPFLENAVIHGVSHLTYPGHITVLFDLKDDLLHIQIQDNGVGRHKAALLKKEREPGHQSVALKVNKERLEALRGKQNYTPLKIEDIIDETGNIGGTVVSVILPVRYLY